MSGPRQDGVDLRHYVRQAWRRKWILLAVVVLIPAATYLLTERQPKVYQASTLLKVAPQNISISTTISFSSSGATETATIIKTTGVARLAARELGEDPSSAGALLGKISTSVAGRGHGGRLPEDHRQGQRPQAGREDRQRLRRLDHPDAHD